MVFFLKIPVVVFLHLYDTCIDLDPSDDLEALEDEAPPTDMGSEDRLERTEDAVEALAGRRPALGSSDP